MDLMGWSSSAMVKRYQYITQQIRMDIAVRVGGWEVAPKSNKSKKPKKAKLRRKGEEPDEGEAVRVPA